MIIIEGVEAQFQNAEGQSCTVLTGVNCRINAGDLAVVTGPASSGKTTLLRTIAGTAPPAKGRVVFDDEDLYRGCPMSRTVSRRYRVGWVVDGFGLLPNISCLENVVMATRLNRNSRDSGEDEARRALRRVGLELEPDLLPSQLCAEERKRLLIGRALINAPRALLVDEPTSGLSDSSARAIIELLAEIHREGQTIVMTAKKFSAGIGTRFFELKDRGLFEILPKTSRRAAG